MSQNLHLCVCSLIERRAFLCCLCCPSLPASHVPRHSGIAAFSGAYEDSTQVTRVSRPQATGQFQLSGLTPGCDLTDLAHFDDTSADGALDINEFYSGFNKLYSRWTQRGICGLGHQVDGSIC